MKLFPDQEAHDKAIRPDLGPYCERNKNPLVNEAIKIIEEENRELKSRVHELEAEVARYKSDIDTTEAATGMSGIYAKLEAERDRLKEQCVRWEAMYEGMMAERDGLDADLFKARQAILTEGQIMMRLEN